MKLLDAAGSEEEGLNPGASLMVLSPHSELCLLTNKEPGFFTSLST